MQSYIAEISYFVNKQINKLIYLANN